ncbi:MAG: tetratricopeptide repeat protein [Cyanobacteriota bacterium]
MFDFLVLLCILYFARLFIINFLFLRAEKNEKIGKYEKALINYRYLTFLYPSNLYDIYNSIGNCFSEIKDYKSAEIYYNKAISIIPDNFVSYKNLGLNFLDSKNYKEAHKYFSKSLRLKHGIPYNEDEKYLENFVLNEDDKIIITIPKIKHDIEQLDYLINRNLLPSSFIEEKENLESLYAYLDDKSEIFFINLENDKRKYIESIYERNLYIYKTKDLNEYINKNIEVNNIKTEFEKNEVAYFDNFLSDECLNEIRNFCFSSTIWHEYKRVWGYLSANLDNGLSDPIFYKIAEEAINKFPTVFKDYNLMNMWAFKYDSSMKGVSVHADEAFININFWITNDDANLDKNTGGLIVYPIKAPDNWTFEEYNADEKLIYDYIKTKEIETITIPYKENRCIIFNSAFFHETDKFNFKEGYENRRINITLLFGKRS